MGISGLLPALKSIIEPQHVRKYAGQKVAVDTVPPRLSSCTRTPAAPAARAARSSSPLACACVFARGSTAGCTAEPTAAPSSCAPGRRRTSALPSPCRAASAKVASPPPSRRPPALGHARDLGRSASHSQRSHAYAWTSQLTAACLSGPVSGVHLCARCLLACLYSGAPCPRIRAAQVHPVCH